MSTLKKQHNILIITTNNSFVEAIEEKLDHNCAISSATDYDCAIAKIEGNQIDLIITCLPSAADNNFYLLTSLDNAKINIPIIVCAHKIPKIDQDSLDSFAAFNFISANIESIEPTPLQNHINTSLDKGCKGHISGVSLASFLQLIELDRKTCTLRIKSSNNRGVLYFQEGELIDAVNGQVQGEMAALEVVGWAPVEIDIWETCRKTEQNIDSPLGFLLIEGTRLSDEKKQHEHNEEKAPEKKVETEIAAPSTTEPPPPAIPDKEQKILDHLIEAVGNYEVKSLLIAKADGTSMTDTNCPPYQAKLMKESVSSAMNLADAFNYHPPKQILIDLQTASRLLIIIGHAAYVGMELPKDLAPTIVIGDLTPMIKRLHFS